MCVEKMKKTKKHGWVLQAGNGRFVTMDGFERSDIREADVYSTRERARTGNGDDDMSDIGPLDTDVVRKVELYKNGNAKKIIPGR